MQGFPHSAKLLSFSFHSHSCSPCLVLVLFGNVCKHGHTSAELGLLSGLLMFCFELDLQANLHLFFQGFMLPIGIYLGESWILVEVAQEVAVFLRYKGHKDSKWCI